MNKRIILFLSILIVLPVITYFVIQLARGYKPDLKNGGFKPTGLLVATSEPKGAQVFVNGKLTSATNTTISLAPSEYEVKIQKDGYLPWQKTLKIQKELVTETNALLFPSVPDLRPLTYNGAQNPLLSPNGQKIAFVVSGASTEEKNGLYVLDLAVSPLTFNRDARQIASTETGLDFPQSQFYWSPDSKQLLVKSKNQNFLLDADKLNSPNQLVDISPRLDQTYDSWQKELEVRSQQRLKKLPPIIERFIAESAVNVLWSPDETKLMYTAQKNEALPKISSAPTLSSGLQTDRRDIKANEVYVYDLKEDKNYYIMNNPEKPQSDNDSVDFFSSEPKALTWFPTSRHLLFVQKDKIIVLEYDNTNHAVVFANAFENGFAYPSPDANRLVILTSLQQEADILPNLYALSLK